MNQQCYEWQRNCKNNQRVQIKWFSPAKKNVCGFAFSVQLLTWSECSELNVSFSSSWKSWKKSNKNKAENRKTVHQKKQLQDNKLHFKLTNNNNTLWLKVGQTISIRSCESLRICWIVPLFAVFLLSIVPMVPTQRLLKIKKESTPPKIWFEFVPFLNEKKNNFEPPKLFRQVFEFTTNQTSHTSRAQLLFCVFFFFLISLFHDIFAFPTTTCLFSWHLKLKVVFPNSFFFFFLESTYLSKHSSPWTVVSAVFSFLLFSLFFVIGHAFTSEKTKLNVVCDDPSELETAFGPASQNPIELSLFSCWYCVFDFFSILMVGWCKENKKENIDSKSTKIVFLSWQIHWELTFVLIYVGKLNLWCQFSSEIQKTENNFFFCQDEGGELFRLSPKRPEFGS